MTVTAEDLSRQATEFLAAHDPATTDPMDFLRARFDAGLAWVHFPAGLGGQDAPRALQSVVDDVFADAGAPDNNPRRIGIGLGMAAPTILAFGTPEQTRALPASTVDRRGGVVPAVQRAGRRLRPRRRSATRAVRDGDDWVVTGQKVWTSGAHDVAVGDPGRPHRPGRARSTRA